MYAGCVHWPFQWNPWIGISIGGLILVGGIGDAIAKAVKKKDEPGDEKES